MKTKEEQETERLTRINNVMLAYFGNTERVALVMSLIAKILKPE